MRDKAERALRWALGETTYAGKCMELCTKININKNFQQYLYFKNLPITNADPGPVRRAPAPLFEFFGGLFFVNFDCKTRIYFYCGHHKLFTIWTLFFTVTKNIGYVWIGHQYKSQTPKILLRRDRAPRFWNSWIRHWIIIVICKEISDFYQIYRNISC